MTRRPRRSGSKTASSRGTYSTPKHPSRSSRVGGFARYADGGGRALSKTIGIVTGGGDCPGLNAVIRAVVKAAAKRGWETLGIIGGYEGLLPPQQIRPLDY